MAAGSATAPCPATDAVQEFGFLRKGGSYETLGIFEGIVMREHGGCLPSMIQKSLSQKNRKNSRHDNNDGAHELLGVES